MLISSMKWEPRIPECRWANCIWVEEVNRFDGVRYYTHYMAGEPKIERTMEQKFMVRDIFLFDKDSINRELGRVYEFYRAHHQDPLSSNFDEERERARLVAV